MRAPDKHSDQGSTAAIRTGPAKTNEKFHKGNCHDTTPGEMIFNLMKWEKLNKIKINPSVEIQAVLLAYVF